MVLIDNECSLAEPKQEVTLVNWFFQTWWIWFMDSVHSNLFCINVSWYYGIWTLWSIYVEGNRYTRIVAIGFYSTQGRTAKLKPSELGHIFSNFYIRTTFTTKLTAMNLLSITRAAFRVPPPRRREEIWVASLLWTQFCLENGGLHRGSPFAIKRTTLTGWKGFSKWQLP